MESSQANGDDNYRLTESFSNAFSGLWIALKSEPTFRIQLLSSVIVVVAGFIMNVSALEWVALILTIGLVLSLELVNTQIEQLIDFFHPEYHEEIGKIKNITAAAVLVSALVAIAIALIIFLPKLM